MPSSLLSALLAAAFVAAPATDPVVTEAVALARDRAMNGPAVDWPAVEAQAQAIAAGAPGEGGRTAAIRHVLLALKDGHSTYRPKPAATPGSTGVLRAPDPIAVAAPPAAGFGHLVINGWSGKAHEEVPAMREVRNALNASMAHDACGLVIDVAANRGGNMWPMMGGIAPLYDDGNLQTFETRAGQRNVVNVAGGVLRMNARPTPGVFGLPPVQAEPAHIALIVGPETASSAEILALGFRYQDNVRVFGRNTRGATTANSLHRLSNGGELALTTARILDRRGALQQGPLIPDQLTDDPLAAATRWLELQCTTLRPAATGS